MATPASFLSGRDLLQAFGLTVTGGSDKLSFIVR
jgi:hypothetical protein